MSKNPRFRTPFKCQHVRKMSWKMSLLVISEILGLFVNTLTTADDKYSLGKRKKLLQPIQILLSRMQKTFPLFFCAFLKST